MKDLIIEKTDATPDINFNYESRRLGISGESFPENSSKFYKPVMNWIREYISNIGDEETVVDFEIIYFNSSTAKIFMTFFSIMDEAVETGKNITINWRVDKDNETIIECGEEFMEDLEFVKFNIVKI